MVFEESPIYTNCMTTFTLHLNSISMLKKAEMWKELLKAIDEQSDRIWTGKELVLADGDTEPQKKTKTNKSAILRLNEYEDAGKGTIEYIHGKTALTAAFPLLNENRRGRSQLAFITVLASVLKQNRQFSIRDGFLLFQNESLLPFVDICCSFEEQKDARDTRLRLERIQQEIRHCERTMDAMRSKKLSSRTSAVFPESEEVARVQAELSVDNTYRGLWKQVLSLENDQRTLLVNSPVDKSLEDDQMLAWLRLIQFAVSRLLENPDAQSESLLFTYLFWLDQKQVHQLIDAELDMAEFGPHLDSILPWIYARLLVNQWRADYREDVAERTHMLLMTKPFSSGDMARKETVLLLRDVLEEGIHYSLCAKQPLTDWVLLANLLMKQTEANEAKFDRHTLLLAFSCLAVKDADQLEDEIFEFMDGSEHADLLLAELKKAPKASDPDLALRGSALAGLLVGMGQNFPDEAIDALKKLQKRLLRPEFLENSCMQWEQNAWILFQSIAANLAGSEKFKFPASGEDGVLTDALSWIDGKYKQSAWRTPQMLELYLHCEHLRLNTPPGFKGGKITSSRPDSRHIIEILELARAQMPGRIDWLYAKGMAFVCQLNQRFHSAISFSSDPYARFGQALERILEFASDDEIQKNMDLLLILTEQLIDLPDHPAAWKCLKKIWLFVDPTMKPQFPIVENDEIFDEEDLINLSPSPKELVDWLLNGEGMDPDFDDEWDERSARRREANLEKEQKRWKESFFVLLFNLGLKLPDNAPADLFLEYISLLFEVRKSLDTDSRADQISHLMLMNLIAMNFTHLGQYTPAIRAFRAQLDELTEMKRKKRLLPDKLRGKDLILTKYLMDLYSLMGEKGIAHGTKTALERLQSIHLKQKKEQTTENFNAVLESLQYLNAFCDSDYPFENAVRVLPDFLATALLFRDPDVLDTSIHIAIEMWRKSIAQGKPKQQKKIEQAMRKVKNFPSIQILASIRQSDPAYVAKHPLEEARPFFNDLPYFLGEMLCTMHEMHPIPDKDWNRLEQELEANLQVHDMKPWHSDFIILAQCVRRINTVRQFIELRDHEQDLECALFSLNKVEAATDAVFPLLKTRLRVYSALIRKYSFLDPDNKYTPWDPAYSENLYTALGILDDAAAEHQPESSLPAQQILSFLVQYMIAMNALWRHSAHPAIRFIEKYDCPDQFADWSEYESSYYQGKLLYLNLAAYERISDPRLSDACAFVSHALEIWKRVSSQGGNPLQAISLISGLNALLDQLEEEDAVYLEEKEMNTLKKWRSELIELLEAFH